MTTTDATTLPGPLLAGLTGLGLQIEPVLPGEAPAVGGSLVAATYTGSDPGAPAPLGLAVAGDDLTRFDAVAGAITAALPDLTASPPSSIGTVTELVETLTPPVALFALSEGGTPIGFIAHQADRRAGTAPATDTGATPAGAAAGAAVAAATGGSSRAGLGLLQDVLLEVTVELGRTSLPLAQLMQLGLGSVLELDRAAGAPVDVRINGVLFARGEVVVVDGEYGARITEILAGPG